MPARTSALLAELKPYKFTLAIAVSLPSPASPTSFSGWQHMLLDPLVWSQLATYLQFLRCTDPHSSRTLQSAHVHVYYTLGNGIPLAASARRREAARCQH